jgi:galactokinase
MRGNTAASALVERGLDRAELAAKGSLFESVLRAFGHLDAGSPLHVFWVPGRLEVFGKHTDYAGGRTLVCAIPRGFAMAVGARDDGRVHVVDAVRKGSVTLPVAARELDAAAAHDAAPGFTGWRHYVEVVVRRLSRNFPGLRIGANVVLGSDLPRASGMSSSSALMVAVASALGRVAQIEERPEWRMNIRGRLDAAAYYACIENGMTFGTLQGDAGVGTHGGSEDHAAIVAGRPGHLLALAFVPMRPIAEVAVPGDWRFVISPSGVTADKTGGARGPYNRLAAGATVLLEVWNSRHPHADSLAGALAGGASVVKQLRDLVKRASIDGWPADALERRLDHFIREDARVPAAVEAFRSADVPRLGSISAESQKDAETLLENQVPATVALAASARALGAFAACSFGAGFGGSVWALVDGSSAAAFAGRWSPYAFVAPPGPALSEI